MTSLQPAAKWSMKRGSGAFCGIIAEKELNRRNDFSEIPVTADSFKFSLFVWNNIFDPHAVVALPLENGVKNTAISKKPSATQPFNYQYEELTGT